jgi:hypothetical protein
MKNIILFIFIITVFFTSCVPVSQQGTGSNGGVTYYSNKKLKYEDVVYDTRIRTALLYPYTGSPNDIMQPAVVPLSQSVPLLLEFDDLGTTYSTYNVKIFHCNADWTPSMLSEIQYLPDFNDYLISTFTQSINTIVPYMHYKFQLPRVKVNGNYMVVVYRDGNSEDFVISKRFIVHSNTINIGNKMRMSSVSGQRETHQQIDLSINYGAMNIVSPQDIKVVIRQNYRWDNAIYELRPLYIREFEKTLDYAYFSGENTFAGGNEWRSFDTRTVMSAGVNIENIRRDNGKIEVNIMEDKNRNFPSYNQQPDINGRFIIDKKETGEGEINADYIPTIFRLKLKEDLLETKVYVFGELTNWELQNKFAMSFDSSCTCYRLKVPLKQGYYNYQYVISNKLNSKNEVEFEGSYISTENNYDVIVYYRIPGTINDQIIGYLTFKSYYR